MPQLNPWMCVDDTRVSTPSAGLAKGVNGQLPRPDNMSTTRALQLGGCLRGKLDTYRVTERWSGFVFLAISYVSSRPSRVLALKADVSNRKSSSQKVVLKSIDGHWRLQNERDVLRRFQDKIPTLRPLVDEVEDDDVPPTIVLKHLDTDLSAADKRQRLTRQQMWHARFCSLCKGCMRVASCTPLSNVLVNEDGSATRFSEIQLGDCGGTVPADSIYAKEGHTVGTDVYRAPEVHLNIPWGTASDIWSFGVMLINLNYSQLRIFAPPAGTHRDLYDTMIVVRQHRHFGPFPFSYTEFTDEETQTAIWNIMNCDAAKPMLSFKDVAEHEIDPGDKAFILKIMQLDPRCRPTASELLADEWFQASTSSRRFGCYTRQEWAEVQATVQAKDTNGG